jgi:hypothetical protein
MKFKDQLSLEEAYTRIWESSEDYSSLSDTQLLDLYKKEFDKQFEGKEDKEKIKKVLSCIKKRGTILANKAYSYAIDKVEQER